MATWADFFDNSAPTDCFFNTCVLRQSDRCNWGAGSVPSRIAFLPTTWTIGAVQNYAAGWSEGFCLKCTRTSAVAVEVSYNTLVIKQNPDCANSIQFAYTNQPNAIADLVIPYSSSTSELSYALTDYFSFQYVADCPAITCTTMAQTCNTAQSFTGATINGAQSGSSTDSLMVLQHILTGYSITICLKCESTTVTKTIDNFTIQ